MRTTTTGTSPNTSDVETSADGAGARGVSDFRDPFLEHRKAQEARHLRAIEASEDPIHSLVTVELNITELCNRVCAFCPRVDPAVYPNRNLNMKVEVARKVAEDLKAAGSRARISFSGFGEALLHKHFEMLIATIREVLPDNSIEVNTNGDRLTVSRIESLWRAGLTNLYVNLYDGPEQIEAFEALFAKTSVPTDFWRLRPHWEGALEDHGLTLNNRSGMVVSPDLSLLPLESALRRACFYPFYKMLIDWDGQVLFCSNDWGREIRIGSVMDNSVREIWLSEEMAAIRSRLSRRDRSVPPCSRCNVHGTLHGGGSYERLVRYYEQNGVLAPGEVPSVDEINRD